MINLSKAIGGGVGGLAKEGTVSTILNMTVIFILWEIERVIIDRIIAVIWWC